MPVVFFASASIFSSLCAEEENTLKTDYHEAAIDGGKSINYKRWNTSRSGKIILTHEETDPTRTGKFNQIDTIVFHDGKKLLHFMSIDGKRMCFYHPETGCTVLHGDSDGDGRDDRIVINDAKGIVVGYST
jgi:hypothetical protein